MPNGVCCLNSLDRTFSNRRCLVGLDPLPKLFGWFLLLLCFKEVPVFNAVQTLIRCHSHTAASDLGQHCLAVFPLWVSLVGSEFNGPVHYENKPIQIY